ncbi:TPA: hypothetical protein QEL76_002452 [Stenotrophomonas maltophilia]|jgi:hypothetical protein|nr:hypothetical protein [Stenotrophomonas maltophilia]
MPNIKKPYTIEEAAIAIDRSNGQKLDHGPDDPRTRNAYNNTGKKLGHEYMHRGAVGIYNTTGDHPTGMRVLTPLENNVLNKSRAANRSCSYRLAHFLLNSSQVQVELGNADAGIGPAQKWLKTVAVTDSSIYGYEAGSDVPKRVCEAAINFRKIGDELFIASLYPTKFLAEEDLQISSLFEGP